MKKWILLTFVIFLSVLGICFFMITSLTAKNTSILEPDQTQVEPLNVPEVPENTPAISEAVAEPIVEESPVADSSSRLIVAAVPSDNTLEFGTIDTETGEYKQITWLKGTGIFSLSDNKFLNLTLAGAAKGYDTSIFSDGLDKIACTIWFPSGESHAGWVNLSESEGRSISYVDVTKKLGEQSGSGFSETTVNYYGIGFTEDGSFVYSDSDFYYPKGDPSFFSVPIEKLNKDYVTPSTLQSFNTLLSGSGIKWENVTSFIDDHTIVFTGHSSSSMKEHYKILFYNSDTGETTSVIPDVEGRKNYCGIVSPDKTKLAFISNVNAERKLFVVPLDGGEPVELATSVPMAFPWTIDHVLNCDHMLKTGYILLDWK